MNNLDACVIVCRLGEKKKIAYLHVCLFDVFMRMPECVGEGYACVCVCPPYTKLDYSRAKMTN